MGVTEGILLAALAVVVVIAAIVEAWHDASCPEGGFHRPTHPIGSREPSECTKCGEKLR